jgi:hypothetical protein
MIPLPNSAGASQICQTLHGAEALLESLDRGFLK